MATHYRTCPLCEAMCGLEIETDGDRVTRVRGDRADVWSKGFICPKGASLGHLHHDPDRLRAPMVRDGREWREVSWPEAFERCGTLLRSVVNSHGIEAVTIYIGNPTVHNYSLSRYSGALAAFSRIPTVWSPGTVDQWPKNLVCAQLYGNPWSIPIPDVSNTDLLVVMGANPHASNGSLLSHPDLIGELDRIRARGGRTIVIDPRRTGTAERADEWIAVNPGTDAALLLAVVAVLGQEGLVDLGPLVGRVRGVEALVDAAKDFTPERVGDWCGVAPERIRCLARELAGARRAAVYGRIGLCNQEFGTLATWLVDALNVLTGRLGVPGGVLFARPAIATISSTSRRRGPVRTGRWSTRVRGAPEVLGQAPVSCLAEEIATPGPGRIRGLITVAGNPVLSSPDAGALDAALPTLEAMISLDNYLNETSRHAHVILPGLSQLEQPHCAEALWGFALRAVTRWSPPVFDPSDRPAEWEILLRLGAILGGTPNSEVDVRGLDDAWFAMRAARHGVGGDDPAWSRHRGPDRIVDLTLRCAPVGSMTLDEAMKHPHGVDHGPSHAGLDTVLRTASGDVELAHDMFFADLDRLRHRMAQPRPPLVLIGRRDVRSNNSWMHNVSVLVRGRDRATLMMHPLDAARLGLGDGDRALVTSAVGQVSAPVEVTDGIRPGVVSLPHGWGHDRDGTRTAVASARPGANVNLLVPGTFLDEPSGNAAVNGVEVRISPLPDGLVPEPA